ncbi:MULTISPECIES: hypothetical protein [unclassified Paenibacillus]|uniref:hypothetical protein n=1 Tax=unclassified Paenibacillus TaxID=185978 RepID=UPI00020D74AF|nr:MULTISPECIES: hypothetical protein [unclassified Paenibacillus]EGL15066.1 hypothetical protein HMPREF9413_5729 [Paenibacillus sp. HGF7]EPD80472.1 hypothetical protein HMPREF1207_05687 [Paenibacillus sp. HGH0039]
MTWNYILKISIVLVIALVGYNLFDYLQKKPIEQVTSSYLKDITSGNKEAALKNLTGEAFLLVSQQNSQADELKSVNYKNVEIKGPIGQLDADVETTRNKLSQRYYFFKKDGNWLISQVVALPTDITRSLPDIRAFRSKLAPDQESVITHYIQQIADGHVSEAAKELVGQAQIKAAAAPDSLPKQEIKLEEITSLGKTTNDTVLVKTKQRIEGVVSQTQTNLFALVQVNNGWKIADVKLLSREKN